MYTGVRADRNMRAFFWGGGSFKTIKTIVQRFPSKQHIWGHFPQEICNCPPKCANLIRTITGTLLHGIYYRDAQYMQICCRLCSIILEIWFNKMYLLYLQFALQVLHKRIANSARNKRFNAFLIFAFTIRTKTNICS